MKKKVGRPKKEKKEEKKIVEIHIYVHQTPCGCGSHIPYTDTQPYVTWTTGNRY